MFIFTKSLPFSPVDYVPYTGRRFTVSFEMKINGKWISSASHFASAEGSEGLLVGFIFVFNHANGKPQSKIKVGIDFKLNQSSPSGSAKSMPFQVAETHLTIQEIVYSAKINEIVDYIFTSGLKMTNLMIIWKEHHRGPFEIRQCSRILANADFLEMYVRNLVFEQESADGRAIESSHLIFKQPGARLNADPILYCLCCLHEFDKGIFGLTLNPRHVEMGAHF